MSVNKLPAYTISNENQRWATSVIPGVKSVLTVAGSGDQALFYKLSGIKIVDTFDITCNARVIQDIKYAAIKNMKREDYVDLIAHLHRADGNAIEFFASDLFHFLPDETREIIKNSKFDMVFGCGLNINSYPENIPTDAEYAKLQKSLNKPFNFIWSDLESLSASLTRKYDLINISNIFDYVHNGLTQAQILHELSKHLNKNGRIAYLPQIHRFSYKNVNLPHLVYERTEKDNNHTRMVIFQRTR